MKLWELLKGKLELFIYYWKLFKQVLMMQTLNPGNPKSKTQEPKRKSLNGHLVPNWELILSGLAFAVALAAAVLHNLFFCESRIMLASDGKHYLHTTGLIVEFFKEQFGSPQQAEFLANSQLAGHLILDGPLMSAIYSPLFLALDKIPTPRDWTILAFGQSSFHALSAALMALIVYRLSASRMAALAAAFAWGLYPTAVLQTGHFMSEIPLSTVLLLVLLALSSKTKQMLSYALAGSCLALVILSKPALIPFAVVLPIISLAWQKEDLEQKTAGLAAVTGVLQAYIFKIRKQICGLLLGLALVLIPWSIFCWMDSGKFVFTAQRQPVFNVATGWNLEADGWAFNPHTPMTKLFGDDDGPLAAAMGTWLSHPQGSLRLGLSKIERMSSYPWNDYKGRALGLDENAQILFHRLINACAAFGFFLFLLSRRKYLNTWQSRILALSSAAIIMHLSYLMVEPQPRYFFTAMPFVFILAIYGIWQASILPFELKSRNKLIGLSLFLALAVSGFVLNIDRIAREFNPLALKERSHLLKQGEGVEKIIDMSASKVPPKAAGYPALLLVDGDKNLENAVLEFNGTKLENTLSPLFNYDWQHYALYDQLREFAPAMRISVADLRQWRAVEIPQGLINWQGRNQVIIKNQSNHATIYGDRRPTRYAFSGDYCNYGLLAASPLAAGAETRFTDPVMTANTKEESTFLPKSAASGLHRPGTRLSDSLRVRIMLVPNDRIQIKQEASNKEASVFKIPVPRELFDQMLWDPGSQDALQMNKVVLYAARTPACNLILPELGQQLSHIKIKIKGKLKALKNPGEVGMLCALRGQNGRIQILGKTPRALSAASSWHDFEITDLVPLEGFGGKAESVQLALYPCPWMEGQYGVSRRATDALFRDITVEISQQDLPRVSGRRFIY